MAALSKSSMARLYVIFLRRPQRVLDRARSSLLGGLLRRCTQVARRRLRQPDITAAAVGQGRRTAAATATSLIYSNTKFTHTTVDLLIIIYIYIYQYYCCTRNQPNNRYLHTPGTDTTRRSLRFFRYLYSRTEISLESYFSRREFICIYY